MKECNKYLIFICLFGILSVGLTGCGFVQSVVDIVCGTPPVDEVLTPEETSKVALYSRLNWVSILSIVGIAISAAAFVNGNKLAISIFCGCVASLGVSLAVVEYAGFLAIGSLVSAVCIFVYSTLIKNRVVKELVTGAQELKEINGNSKLGSKVLFDSQSVSTRKIVNKVKDTLKLQGKM